MYNKLSLCKLKVVYKSLFHKIAEDQAYGFLKINKVF